MNLYSLGGQVLVWTNKLNAGLCKNTKMFKCALNVYMLLYFA